MTNTDSLSWLWGLFGLCRHEWMAWHVHDEDFGTQRRACRKCNFTQEKDL